MRLPGARYQLLSGSFAVRILSVHFRLVAFQGSRASTEGTLPGSFAFLARAGTRAHRTDGACTTASMAEAGAQAEWPDVR